MKILLFGITKKIVGDTSLIIPFSDRKSYPISDVQSLKNYLVDLYPEFRDLSSLAVAVNDRYAEGDTAIGENDEIALIPPVSGG
ncbi:MAG: MoaD/ThiS family protein [Balneolaceae bacterium]|nr:MoaD/ThiS family protein [Balneolaceae bacterium]